MRNNDVAEWKVDQRYITQRYTNEALKFIDKNSNKPFFLYVAHSMPHIPIYASEKFVGTSKQGLYGDVIQELDWSVGEIVKKIREKGLEENTLIVFSSDNGPWLVMGEDAGSAGPLREGKQTTFEGGMRVPAVAYWKGKLPGGKIVNEMATMMDWFPTLTKLGGGKLPKDRAIDGEDIFPLLTGQGKRKGNQLAYYFNGKLEAFRLGDWKLKLPFAGTKSPTSQRGIEPHTTLLYHLKDDVGEKNNLAEKHPEKVKEIETAIGVFVQSLGKLPMAKVQTAGADKSLSKDRKPASAIQ